MAESEDEDSSLNLTGFLFGNINEKGELEDTEILDEVIYSTEWFIAAIVLRKMVIVDASVCQQMSLTRSIIR